MKRLTAYLRSQWKHTTEIVRGDSHLASKDFMKWCDEANNIGFITGLTGNKKLHELANGTIESAKREYKQYGKPVKRYHTFMYQAGSWSKPPKVVVKVEAGTKGVNIRYIVTNTTNSFRIFRELIISDGIFLPVFKFYLEILNRK